MLNDSPDNLTKTFRDLLRQEKFGSQSEIVTELQKLWFSDN